MAKAKFHAADGSVKAESDLPASHFDQPVNEAIMWAAVDVFMANQRQGTHKTKTRAEVSGGGKKPWKQKGTGRARQGSNTAPNWARGGKAHGPMPRKYTIAINAKVKKKALLSALSSKAAQGQVHVFESLNVNAPKTRELASVLAKAELAGARSLILVTEPEKNLMLAARNIRDLSVERVADVSTYSLLNADNLILTDLALKALVESRKAA
jgi:large subunit ribosomal protein L4